MKLFNFIIFIVVIIVISSCSPKQETGGESQTEVIATPGVLCGMCAKNIEKAVGALEGIESIEIDVEKKVSTVRFLPAKTDLNTIEASIAKVGYDANDVKKDAETYDKLAACCKVDG
jgi:mercuric ion binding protein